MCPAKASRSHATTPAQLHLKARHTTQSFKIKSALLWHVSKSRNVVAERFKPRGHFCKDCFELQGLTWITTASGTSCTLQNNKTINQKENGCEGMESQWIFFSPTPECDRHSLPKDFCNTSWWDPESNAPWTYCILVLHRRHKSGCRSVTVP